MTTPTTQPDDRCEQIARELISAWMTKNNYPDARYQGQLREAIAAALQAKQDKLNALREEVLGVLEPFVSSFMKGKERYDKAQSDWFEKMPGEWPQDLTVKVQDCRAAKALRDKLKASQPTSPQPQTPHQ